MSYRDYEIPKDLIFRTRDILDMDGLDCSALLEPADFDDVFDAPCKITKITIKLHFSVAGKDIYVRGEVEGRVMRQCGRCLEMFEDKFAEEFTELYSTKSEIIDIMYTTKQTLALVNNISSVCSKDCKGLCEYCGANKNKTQCDCEAPSVSPFAVLKDKFSK